jgi:phenylacetate-CoA ligase
MPSAIKGSSRLCPQYLLKKLYEASPDFVRNTVGSAFGRLSPGLRYGPAFARARRLLLESRTWDEKRLNEFRLNELRKLLTYAGERVPYYRRLFRGIGFSPASLQSLDELAQLPLLTRDMVRDLGRELLAEGLDERTYKHATTGGTSGNPLGFYATHDASAAEWAFILKIWEGAGFRPGDKRVMLRGRLTRNRRSGECWEYDPVNQALCFSAHDLSDACLSEYVKRMQKYKPAFLHSYPSAATLLAQYLQRTGGKLPSLRGVLTNSENLYPAQREFLSGVFGCRVFSFYGNSEKSILASECECSTEYHISPEYGIVELVDGAGRPGQRGMLAGTGFLNRATVLIRYLTDDEAEWSQGPCACGRTSPRLRHLRGRWQEMLVGRSGALISSAAAELHAESYSRIRQFQFYQDTPGRVTLRIARLPNYTDADEAMLTNLLRRFNEELEVHLEYSPEIPKTSAGKFRLVDQRLPIEYPSWT